MSEDEVVDWEGMVLMSRRRGLRRAVIVVMLGEEPRMWRVGLRTEVVDERAEQVVLRVWRTERGAEADD